MVPDDGDENGLGVRVVMLVERFHVCSRSVLVSLTLLVMSGVLSSCQYEISIHAYDPTQACNGLTLFAPHYDNRFLAVDMEGNVVLEFERPDFKLDTAFEILEDGSLLILGDTLIYRFRWPDTVVWAFPHPQSSAHHSVIQMPNGHIMYLYYYLMDAEGWDRPFGADGIIEADPYTGEIFWVWKVGDHLSTDDYCPWHIETFGLDASDNYDWTHSNTVVYREEESAVYMNIRHLDRLVKIDYPSGEILWSMGRGGDFGEGLFSHSHDSQFLENGNLLLFDNGNHRLPVEYSRAVEIAFDPDLGWAEIVWAWPTEPLFFDSAMGNVNRLSNGNTLLTSAYHGTIYEVTPAGEIVWDMRLDPIEPFLRPWIYKSERIPALDFHPFGLGRKSSWPTK